jgi:hypothetical protein
MTNVHTTISKTYHNAANKPKSRNDKYEKEAAKLKDGEHTK